MSLADDLAKLEQLRGSEALTAQEFEDAKHKLLYPTTDAPVVVQRTTIGPGFQSEATEYFARQNRSARNAPIFGIIALIIFIIAAIAMFSAFSNSDPNQSPYGNSTCTIAPDGSMSCE